MSLNRKLLVVDDNDATRYAMRRVLARHGYEVLESDTGGGGLAIIASQTIDALVLDVNLPDMSGFDVVRQLRSNLGTALLPVVHVSAASIESGDLIMGLDAGADAYLIHPVDPDVLLATLRTLLRVRDVEQALGESEARFKEIFANVAAPIAVIDARLNVLDSNHAFSRLVQREILTDSLSAYFADGQLDALQALNMALEKHQRWNGMLRMEVGEEFRDVDWRVAPYRAPDLSILFADDVTEQRLRERLHRESLDNAQAKLAAELVQRERTEDRLRQSQKMDALGKLTGGIAHDFNNLLTGIITGTELLNARVENLNVSGVTKLVAIVLTSARRAAALTHRLLAFARQQPLHSQAIDINERMLSLDDLLRRTIGERITLSMELSDQPVVAKADPNQLENAILNLVINARDALPGVGKICIVTTNVALSEDADLPNGDYVSVAVSDNGTGIPADVLERVFEPFFTTKDSGSGTGLGLAMIYGFARQSNGAARITSTVGEGTAVTILLPADKLRDDQPVEAPTRPANGKGEHILLVDDMPDVRAVLAEILVAAGYHCSEASDAAGALAILRGEQVFDLLLTDLGLPDRNGRELAELALAIHPSLPVLFVTGYAENAARGAEFLGPRMQMVTKPFATEIILNKVRAMLDLA